MSPADLVATVQAGTPIEALRRRLADEGMWLALDPPGRPERSLGSVVATATAGPLRHGFGPVRDHVLGCTVATGDGRLVRAGGRVVKNVAGLRPHQAPGRRLRRLRHHRRGAPAAPGAAARRRHADRARPARHAHLGGARPRRGAAPARRRSSSSRPRWRRSPTGCSPRGSSAPTPRCRPTSAGSSTLGDLAWQPLPADRTAAFWSLVARGSLGGPDHPPPRRAGRRRRRDHRSPGPRSRRRAWSAPGAGAGMIRWTGDAPVERLRARAPRRRRRARSR